MLDEKMDKYSLKCKVLGLIPPKIEKTSTGYKLVKADANSVECIIPEFVTEIAQEAFMNCRLLKSVVIPNSIREIGHRAFAHCVELESITIPDGVEVIGVSAFVCCVSLRSIIIPSSVKSIGISAFDYCAKLKITNL